MGSHYVGHAMSEDIQDQPLISNRFFYPQCILLSLFYLIPIL